jgi:hypothetical protein
MRISFDLDRTLIPGNDEFKTEYRNLFQFIFNVEKIRKGTIELFKYLQSKGHQISIYTTSYRKPLKIWFSFRSYGLKIEKIVSQTKNEGVLKKLNIKASKYPPAFSIDLHIDDSEGLEIEGKELNFNIIIIDPKDLNWCDKLKQKIKQFENYDA